MKHLCIALIRFYRKYLSRLKGSPTCRFTPTCSAYALEAYQKRGFFAGTVISLLRILRCNPYSAGGYDPVPEHGLRYRAIRAEVSLAFVDGGGNECDISSEVGPGTHTAGDDAPTSREENSAEEPAPDAEEKNP